MELTLDRRVMGVAEHVITAACALGPDASEAEQRDVGDAHINMAIDELMSIRRARKGEPARAPLKDFGEQ